MPSQRGVATTEKRVARIPKEKTTVAASEIHGRREWNSRLRRRGTTISKEEDHGQKGSEKEKELTK
jgi:hypothetical protein